MCNPPTRSRSPSRLVVQFWSVPPWHIPVGTNTLARLPPPSKTQYKRRVSFKKNHLWRLVGKATGIHPHSSWRWGRGPPPGWSHPWRKCSRRWRTGRPGWEPARRSARWSGRCGSHSWSRSAASPLGTRGQKATGRGGKQQFTAIFLLLLLRRVRWGKKRWKETITSTGLEFPVWLLFEFSVWNESSLTF